MSKIKEINPTDAVLCWVGNSKEELENKMYKDYILFELDKKYYTIYLCFWFFAEPVEI